MAETQESTEMIKEGVAEKEVFEQDALIVTELLEDKLVLSDTDDIEFLGTPEQRQEMCASWVGYIGEIKNPDNTAVNPFFKQAGGKGGSLYSPLDEVLNNTRPVLSKHGFGLMQSPTYKDGMVSVKTVLVHKAGGAINFPALTIPISKKDAQGIIAGVTYARRGSLNPIVATHGETDDDGNMASGNTSTKTSKKTLTAAEKKLRDTQRKLVDLIVAKGGGDNKELMALVKKYEKDSNVNKIKDQKTLDELHKEILKMEEK